MSNTGVPGVFDNDSDNHFSIQQSDVAQMEEEKRLLEESLVEDGLGLTGGQFFPPDPDSDIGREYFSSAKSARLFAEEQQRNENKDSSDLSECKRFIESNRFRGLVPIIAMMDHELYYRISQMKSRTSTYVLKILITAEMNYKIHEAGIFREVHANLKKWVELLKKFQNPMLSRNEGEAHLASVMRYMPPYFFDRLDVYSAKLTEVGKKNFLPTLNIARDYTAFYSQSRFWEYRSGNLHMV